MEIDLNIRIEEVSGLIPLSSIHFLTRYGNFHSRIDASLLRPNRPLLS